MALNSVSWTESCYTTVPSQSSAANLFHGLTFTSCMTSLLDFISRKCQMWPKTKHYLFCNRTHFYTDWMQHPSAHDPDNNWETSETHLSAHYEPCPGPEIGRHSKLLNCIPYSRDDKIPIAIYSNISTVWVCQGFTAGSWFSVQLLTLSKMTNFSHFQPERVCRKQLQICWKWKKVSKWLENTVRNGEIACYKWTISYMKFICIGDKYLKSQENIFPSSNL